MVRIERITKFIFFVSRFLLLLCAVYGLISFMVSFFPTKPIVPRKYHDDLAKGPPPSFDRAVLIVIDSLRADFLLSEQVMTFTRSLILEGAAHAFLAEAVVPTVTMPRIKALTSGTIPVFMDVALNFDSSSAFKEDNIVDRLKEANKTVVFYGDDTWLKLFPTQFDRFEGVSSFFVSDTREVDDNVTRRLLPDLEKSDWSAMIGHLLGLDHAGHLSGPHSALTNAKKKEVDALMETVFKRLFDNPLHERTLLVLASDHGMNERGNHGGADTGEVSSLLVFISPKFKSHTPKEWRYHNASQVDLAATLSALLGLPIPRQSVGRVLLPPLTLLSADEQLQVLEANAQQLRAAFDEISDDATRRDQLDLLYREAAQMRSNGRPFNDVVDAYLLFINSVNRILKEQLTRIDIGRVYASLALLSLSSLAILLISLSGPQFSIGEDLFTRVWACSLMAVYALFSYPHLDPFLMAGLAFSGSVLYQLRFHWRALFRSGLQFSDVVVLILEISSNILMLSSSYVEEEQFISYSLSIIYALSVIARESLTRRWTDCRHALAWLFILRLVSAWNRSGNKALHEWDFAKALMSNENALHLQVAAAIAAVLVLLGLQLRKRSASVIVPSLVFTMLWTLAVGPLKGDLMNVFGCSQVTLARIGYLASALHILFCVFPLSFIDLPRLVLSILQFMFVVHRSHNLGVLVLFASGALLVLPSAQTISVGWVESLCVLHWLGQALFFGLGNTNSLATIDIGAAYTGLGGYFPIAVGLLIFVLMYSGHLLLLPAFIATVRTLQQKRAHLAVLRIPFLLLAIKLLALSIYGFVLVIMRHHLFIWSVFAPRLLYLLIMFAFETLRCTVLLFALPLPRFGKQKTEKAQQ